MATRKQNQEMQGEANKEELTLCCGAAVLGRAFEVDMVRSIELLLAADFSAALGIETFAGAVPGRFAG